MQRNAKNLIHSFQMFPSKYGLQRLAWALASVILARKCSWVCTVASIKCGRSFVFVLKSNALWSFLLAWRHLYWKSIATLVFCYSLAKIMSKLRKTKLTDTEWYWYIDSYWLTMFRWCLQRHCFSCFCWRRSALDWFVWPVPLLDASFEEDQGCAPSHAKRWESWKGYKTQDDTSNPCSCGSASTVCDMAAFFARNWDVKTAALQ